MTWVWIGPVVAAVATAVTRCVVAKIRAASQRRVLEVTLKDTSPQERVAILQALHDWAKSE
ncbi:hypothetical protein ABZU76_38475 [Amycolatopsis sp. NPDC005232]|uniref:hypothetical protein n=1 Tax=Amycolatopsis sp. NPDC005232 TaxID=3157027 RepID=UPI0033B76A76